MKYTNRHSGFTLVELIVSIMIFGIMMISVMSIFLFSSQMSSKVELNRVLQENIKSVVEDIAENIRKNDIRGTRNFGDTTCTMPDDTYPVLISDGICIGEAKYFLGIYDEGLNAWTRVSDIPGNCSSVESLCRVIKKEAGNIYPLTNSFVNFESISFTLSNSYIPKVVVNITARPSYNKGLSPSIVANNTMHIQTTISERLIETK